MATETKTFYPGEYDVSDYAFQTIKNETNPVGKGTNNGDYAYFYASAGAQAYTFWPFDLAAIPSGAVIDSLACKAKVGFYMTNYITSATVQLYSGNTPKGSAVSFLGNIETVVTLDAGVWTRAELSKCRLRVAGVANGGGTGGRRIHFYGADLTVTYTHRGQRFMLKIGGDYNEVSHVFKKTNGIWVEQEELDGVVDQSKRLANGGEAVVPQKTVTVTGWGNTTSCHLLINNTKVYSPGSYTVDAGTTVSCYVAASAGSFANVVVDGITVLSGSGTYSHAVYDDCTINLFVDVDVNTNHSESSITITTQ